MWVLHVAVHVAHPTSRRRSRQHVAARAEHPTNRRRNRQHVAVHVAHLTSKLRAYQKSWRLSVSDGRQSQNGNSQTRLIMIKSR